MAGVKQAVTFQVQDDAVKMLKAAAEKYSLEDESKALRVILDYVIEDGDWDEIFDQIRCIRCGGRPGWSGDEAS